MSDLSRQDNSVNNNNNNAGMHQNGYISVIPPVVYGNDMSMFSIPSAQYVQPAPYNMHSQSTRDFWLKQMHEIHVMEQLKQHDLPLARIKKIVKSDEDVRQRGQVCHLITLYLVH